MKSMSDIRRDEKGLVSILVTMIMIIVITLIVIGFTQVTNRNNREALDKQLSAQAFYAAESGVNQAITKINSASNLGNLDTQTECAGSGSMDYGTLPVLSTSPDVQVTCLFVNPVNENIVTSADVSSSSVVPIDAYDQNGSSPRNLNELSFTWTSPDTVPASPAAACNSDFAGGFPKDLSANNCAYAVLRVDIMQYQSPSSIKLATTAADQTESFYLVPSNSSGTDVKPGSFVGGGTKAYISRSAICTQSSCTATIDLSSANPGNKRYFARISSLYKSAPTVVIDGVDQTNSNAYFKGIFKIDATGKAQDVLRRVQVRYNPYQVGGSPFSALQTTGAENNPGAGICKRITVVSNGLVVPDGFCK